MYTKALEYALKLNFISDMLCFFQTNVGGDYYTDEYDYTNMDGSQPETPTDTTEQSQVSIHNPVVGIIM